MPVRFLIYLAEEYQKLVKQAQESLYGSKQLILPTPQCIVFYNGTRDMPEFRYRAEVLGMLLEEFDVDKYERSLREEGREEGTKQGVDKMARLVRILMQSGRAEDLERASTDEEYREKLFREFKL